MARGKTGSIYWAEIETIGAIPIQVKEYPRRRVIRSIHRTAQHYWYEELANMYGGVVVIWERNGASFKCMSHPIPRKLFDHIADEKSTWKFVKTIARYCRYTKKQIELANLARALDGR